MKSPAAAFGIAISARANADKRGISPKDMGKHFKREKGGQLEGAAEKKQNEKRAPRFCF
jgi:hypothetical protein